MKDYRLIIVHGSRCSSKFMGAHQEIYSHWKEMWKATFQELDGVAEVASDNFARQDEVLAIFHLQKCVAVICHRFVDLRLQSSIDDSYFSTWPEDAIQTMRKMGDETLIGNQISIDPSHRKLSNGMPMKDVLLWLFLRRFQTKSVNLVVGGIREDKALDKLFLKFGAKMIKPNVIQHHVPVALVCFRQNDVHLESSGLPYQQLNEVYENREEDFHSIPQSFTPQQIRRAA